MQTHVEIEELAATNSGSDIFIQIVGFVKCFAAEKGPLQGVHVADGHVGEEQVPAFADVVAYDRRELGVLFEHPDAVAECEYREQGEHEAPGQLAEDATASTAEDVAARASGLRQQGAVPVVAMVPATERSGPSGFAITVKPPPCTFSQKTELRPI